MTIYGHFQYILYIFGIHLWSMLYPKQCYNEPFYKEVEVYMSLEQSQDLKYKFGLL